MGNVLGTSSGEPIPKTTVLRVLTSARSKMMQSMLEAKRQNIKDRLQYYKVDSEKYKEVVMNFMKVQPQLVQKAIFEACTEVEVNPNNFGQSMQQHMMDPEVRGFMGQMQTISADMCENQPFPEEFDLEKLKEIMRVQIEEIEKYEVNDPSGSLVAQICAADEVYQRYGLDEVQIGSLALKYESTTDEELLELREKFNQVSKFDQVARGLNSGQSCSDH